MEVVLLKMRISGKRSQDHQEEQQAKILKNSDEEMDTGKMEDEEDDGYQPNIKHLPWGMEDEVIFVSRSGEILEQERWQGKKSWILWRSPASTRMPQLREGLLWARSG